MLNHFKVLKANQNSMRPVIVDGKEWTLCTAIQGESVFDFRNNLVKGGQRAQYQSWPLMEHDMTHGYEFEIQIPSDWVINNDYVNFHDLHCRHVSGIYYGFYIIGNRLRAVVHTQPEMKGQITDYYMEWAPDHPYHFKLDVHLSLTKGYIQCTVNDVEWFYYKGPTLFQYDLNPYWKVGPYVATDNWVDPLVNNRKILVRI